MEKKKPTIDEIYKLNVDGLFESTANWFDNAFKKSQAEINRDLYNKINGYSSSSESTGGTVSLRPLLTSLNDSNLYPSRGYLYYNGNDWEFNTPTVSGGGGGVVDTAAITEIVNNTIKNVSWWGQKINNNKVDGNIVITKGSHSFTIELDDNGNLKFNGNIYATGGITALGVGTTTGGGSGVSLGTLLTQLNNDNPFPTANGQVLTYNGTNFVWKTPTGGSGGSTTGGIRIKRNGSTLKDSTGNVLSCTSINFKYGENWNSTPILINSDNEISVDLSVVANNGNGSSSSTLYPFTIYNGSSNTDYITYDGSSAAYLRFKNGFSISKVGLGYEISVSGGGSGSSTGGSVDLSSYLTKTEASTTYAAKSHTHSAANITNFESTVKGITVDNAKNAESANKLASSIYLWGNSFNGVRNIGSSTSNKADLRYVNNIYTDNTFGIYNTINGIDTSLLSINNTPNVSVAYGYRSNENAVLSLYGNKTKIYTNGQNYHFDFIRNVFDVNSNQIRFGSETNGGKISWDAANNAFKIEGNVYATGGITALGVSNNATTSNNVDFTFRSVTANTFNVMDSIQLSDALKLRRNGDDIELVNTNPSIDPSLYLGDGQEYYIDTNGVGFFSRLYCYTLDVPGGAKNFHIVDVSNTSFAIEFTYNDKTYKFTASGDSVTVS